MTDLVDVPMQSYADGRAVVWAGDCMQLLSVLGDNSIDSIVTDPPYGLGFMGKKWDALPPSEDWARECLRVLKPGGHLLAFGGSRTWHRLAVAIEDAGFEIRDSIAWLYGSGFPKSLDVSKAIDKAAGAEREVVGSKLDRPGYHLSEPGKDNGVLGGGHGLHADPEARAKAAQITAPATPDAEHWQGWGTALKPAFEPVVVGRKPLEGTVASNVLRFGVGALNIEGCRVESGPEYHDLVVTQGGKAGGGFDVGSSDGTRHTPFQPGSGRWPANVVLDESQAVALDEQSGILKSGANPAIRGGDTESRTVYGGFTGGRNEQPRRGTDSGGASRFFYVAKAPKSERPVVNGIAHPTVKPLALMRWLVRLVTPPDGLVLDTFAGSGTTGEAALLEGFRVLLAEDPSKGEADYTPLIAERLRRAELATAEERAS